MNHDKTTLQQRFLHALLTIDLLFTISIIAKKVMAQLIKAIKEGAHQHAEGELHEH